MKNKDFSGWSITLVALTFVVVPAFLLFYFLMPDWNPNAVDLNIGFLLLISFGFVIYSFLINILFMWLRIVKKNSLAFIIPISISLMIIFITYDLPLWSRLLLATSGMLTVIPINMFIYRKSK